MDMRYRTKEGDVVFKNNVDEVELWSNVRIRVNRRKEVSCLGRDKVVLWNGYIKKGGIKNGRTN